MSTEAYVTCDRPTHFRRTWPYETDPRATSTHHEGYLLYLRHTAPYRRQHGGTSQRQEDLQLAAVACMEARYATSRRQTAEENQKHAAGVEGLKCTQCIGKIRTLPRATANICLPFCPTRYRKTTSVVAAKKRRASCRSSGQIHAKTPTLSNTCPFQV